MIRANIKARLQACQTQFLIVVPLLWLVLFVLLPLFIVMKLSLSEAILASPPFKAWMVFEDATLSWTLYFKHYLNIFYSDALFQTFLGSVWLAFKTTVWCILIGYPLTLAIVNTNARYRPYLFLLILLPYWISFLLRAYAWSILLHQQGLMNDLFIWLKIIEAPIRLMYTPFAVQIGLIYGYLPFFILPLAATLVRINQSYPEAAQDLGAGPFTTFFKIILPLSYTGLFAGALLVFIPATGEVVVPQILGGLSTPMIGNIIWEMFFKGNDWCLTAALSTLLLVLLFLPIYLLWRLQNRIGDYK